MKNQEQTPQGGGIARTKFQQFMQRKEWLDIWSEEDKQLAVDLLQDASNMETEALKYFTKEYTRLYKGGQDNHHEAREEACSRAHRLSLIAKLSVTIRYVNPELALYARDN